MCADIRSNLAPKTVRIPRPFSAPLLLSFHLFGMHFVGSENLQQEKTISTAGSRFESGAHALKGTDYHLQSVQQRKLTHALWVAASTFCFGAMDFCTKRQYFGFLAVSCWQWFVWTAGLLKFLEVSVAGFQFHKFPGLQHLCLLLQFPCNSFGACKDCSSNFPRCPQAHFWVWKCQDFCYVLEGLQSVGIRKFCSFFNTLQVSLLQKSCKQKAVAMSPRVWVQGFGV